jgi:ABC-type multidrug transport system ATPase subunit
MNRTTDISQPILSVSGIRKKFGPRTVLKSISLDLKPGDCTVLQGDNGVGKSTLLKILAGTLKPDEFDFIRINGEDSYNSPSYRKMIGSVNHQLMAYGDLDALDNSSDLPRGCVVSKQIIKRSSSFGSNLTLSARVHDPVRTYSRGMQSSGFPSAKPY